MACTPTDKSGTVQAGGVKGDAWFATVTLHLERLPLDPSESAYVIVPFRGALLATVQEGVTVPMGQELTVVLTLTDVLRFPVLGPVEAAYVAAPPMTVAWLAAQAVPAQVKLGSVAGA